MIGSVPTRKLTAAALCLSVLAGSALAACGGDDDDGTAPTEATSTTLDPSEAAEAALEARLLTPADLDTGNPLDAGWEVGDVSAGVSIELPDCVTEETDPDAVATAETKLVTKNDLKLPSLEEYLGTYEGDGAADALAAATERLDGCEPEFVYEGTPSLGTTERLPLTLGGEDAVAWRTSVTIAGAAVSITNVHVRVDDVVMALVHVDLGTPDPAVVGAHVATALAKLTG